MPDQPIPAATLVLFREHAAGAPELLMVERARSLAFAGGALVFPGGRVDPGDLALAASFALDRDDAASRIAAIRETIEEAGIAVGLVPAPAPGTVATLRARLHAGVAFRDALALAGLTLDPGDLVPFARWLPLHGVSRVFDTRFYLARLPDTAPPATVDATENTRLVWQSAADVLRGADAGAATIIYPTRRNLERLARFADFAAACADAAARPVRTITPFVDRRGDGDHLCIPEGLGYPVTSQPIASVVHG